MSGTSSAWTSAGIDDFSAGPTNFVLSFSGANARGDFLKFDVKYPDDDRVYSILAPTDDFDSINVIGLSEGLDVSVSSVGQSLVASIISS